MTKQVQLAIAQYFPEDYHLDTWQNLLPEFINQQLRYLREEGENRTFDQRRQNKGNDSDAAPVSIKIPPIIVHACELQVQRMQLTPDALACAFFMAKERADNYSNKLDECRLLCTEFNQTSMELARDYQALERSTKLDKRQN